MLAPASKRITSLSRTCEPFMRYSFCPSRYTMRSMTTSLKSISSNRCELSKVTFTLARFCSRHCWRSAPDQIFTSTRLRMLFIDCSPSTNRNASATLLLPEPLGPTIEAIGDVKASSDFLPNDLNPESSIDLRLRCIDDYCSKKEEAPD